MDGVGKGLWTMVNEASFIWENNTSKAYWPVILERTLCCPITEWQIDIIKENISQYCEATIDHSQLSYQQKEDQKRQMKQSLEVYIKGVKDEMRGMGRMI